AAARAPVFVVRAVRRPPRPTPFPYTTLFRSIGADEGAVADAGGRLVHAVVVAGDGAGTDVDAGADLGIAQVAEVVGLAAGAQAGDRKSTRLNSSHVKISYAVFCLKKKTEGGG